MAEDLDSELLAHQEEDERRQAEEFERQQQRELRGRARQLAMRAAQKKIRQAAEKRAAVAAAEGAGAAASAIAAAAVPILTVLLIIFVVILLVFVIIVVICYPPSFIQRNTPWGLLLSGVIPQDICQSISSLSGIATTIEKGIGAMCAAPMTLARQYSEPYPQQNDPDLIRLVQCISSVTLGAGACVDPGNSLVGSIATCDASASTCNYTRGAEVCQQCTHSVSSCHYGGATGSTGALAVDFGNEDNGAQILQAAISCSQSLGIPLKRATCEAQQIVSGTSDTAIICSDPSATHIHISLAECSADNGPINTQ